MPGPLALCRALVMAALLSGCPAPESPATRAPAKSFFVGVTLPIAIESLVREQNFDRPLHAALKELALGEVTGGGTQLGPPKADGTHDVLWAALDVDLVDFERGLPALRVELKKLQAPPGTLLQYQGKDGRQIKELLW
jgi:hypothetical protein